MKFILYEAVDPGEAVNLDQVHVQTGDPQDNDSEETYLEAKEDSDHEAEEAEERDDVSFLKVPETMFADGSTVIVAQAQA
ncbi:hypothetical protein KI688_011930 [Linnemannia hyalina]|uniref:Uncharacterized protein n=1 Tax=Linnemannia hyalina TaxID=64524 RepID=A0A9P8BSI2_9FUNG|nr:hypothetical protein KI688_011930 [Linnemannia hyalina]